MEELHTVHYVSQDPLPNLKLRVTLTRLSAASRDAQPGGAAASRDDRHQAHGSSDAASSTQDGAAGAGSAGTQPPAASRPEPFRVSRTFAWQEKVFSRAELAATQAHLRATQPQQQQQQVRREQQQEQQQQQQQQPSPGAATQFSSPKRTAHFGSQSHVATDRLLTADPEGSILFSYVQTDQFVERYETSKRVTTASSERANHLVAKLARDARNRQQMLNFQAMFIVADLGGETSAAGSSERVLCAVRGHADGSFDMTPGFSIAGRRYRFEDEHGAIFEYSIELASQSCAPSLERRAAKLAVAVAAQAEQLRRQQSGAERLPCLGPDAGALRLLLLAELVSAAGFERDRLYVEWQLRFDPELWALQHSEQEVAVPGIIQGVTHVSQMTCYAADPSTDTPPVWVAHFAHPIEVEWVATRPPHPRDWPRLLLQVCTYDPWDRATTEGYGWMQLGPAAASGSATHYVATWKPLGSRRDQQAAFFIGASEALADVGCVAVPPGHQGRCLNKYGLKTQTSGSVKVRTHVLLQSGTPGGVSPRKGAADRRAASAAAARQRRSLSLAVVLERARSRLQEARGGELVLREGLLSQPPAITVQPSDAAASEGATVRFSITAAGSGPLRYQWFRDGKRLTVATSMSPLLVLVDVAAADGGVYHCCVSNLDGTASSSKALLGVTRISRLQAATTSSSGSTAAELGPGSSSSSGAAGVQLPSLSSTLARRMIVPRTLPRAGGGGELPFSMRFGSSSGTTAGGTSSSGSPGALSPLRASRAGRLGAQPAASGAVAAEHAASSSADAGAWAVRRLAAASQAPGAGPGSSSPGGVLGRHSSSAQPAQEGPLQAPAPAHSAVQEAPPAAAQPLQPGRSPSELAVAGAASPTASGSASGSRPTTAPAAGSASPARSAAGTPRRRSRVSEQL